MKILKLLICFYLLGCTSSEQRNKRPSVSPLRKDSSQQVIVIRRAKSIEDLPNYTWTAHHPDTTGYLCEIHFKDEYAINFFHGQCAYFFFTSTTYAKSQQQVQLIWTYKTDCSLDLPFLEKANGVKRYPKHGDIFATYRLINDTTLCVKYTFPDWVKKVNQIARDSLFPQMLYLEKPGGT